MDTKCPVCGSTVIVVVDEDKEIIKCLDCRLTTKPMKMQERLCESQ